jgi:nicotinamide mononucleotide (NMN) deamidase PncC/nicotinic acid mononucleotide adenylyltransferase
MTVGFGDHSPLGIYQTTVSLTPSRLIRRIHGSPLRIVLATTGGGSSAVEGLLAVPGASRTVLEGVVPYSAAALEQFLGAAPEHYCSQETARAMAMAAFQRALTLDVPPSESNAVEGAQNLALAGVACTASLATDRPKRGPHRAHLAVQTATATVSQSIELAKGRRTRHGEEKLVGRLMINLVAQTAGLAERLPLSLLPEERLVVSQTVARQEWTHLLLGNLPAVRHGPVTAAGRKAIFPGAFHPRHAGHLQIAELAQRHLGAAVEYEIAMLNVDKPPLDFQEMEARLRQFGPQETLWFTRAPRFEQKAELFPGATFLVGADTIVRIGDPRYYGGDETARDRAVAHLAERKCRFVVFGRLMEQSFRSLSDLQLPAALAALCEEVPAAEFRADISSTEIRREGSTEDSD